MAPVASIAPLAPVAMVAPAAPPAAPAAPPPAASDSGTDINTALKRMTNQIDNLTKAIDKHTEFIAEHENRMQFIENYLNSKDFSNTKPLGVWKPSK
jgi:hypothetical protein